MCVLFVGVPGRSFDRSVTQMNEPSICNVGVQP